jgi:anti-anti-sigma factor
MTALTGHFPFVDQEPEVPERARLALTRIDAKEAPAPPALLVTERRLHGCAVMSVRGEVDIATVEQLDHVGTRLLASAGGRLVLDLSETTFMDLSGVRSAERLSRLASESGGSFVLVAVTPGVRRILALAAHPWLAMTGDLDTALEAVADRAAASDEAI